MGLTVNATGTKAIDNKFVIKRINENDKIIALAGNPNVGKSTIFNLLTGLKQHTGNWAGKTVTNALGKYNYNGINYTVIDIPGTYSLMTNSTDEEVARDLICFGDIDGIVVVCDATCLERNLNLVLQILEINKNIIVCVNLIDEAKKKNIEIDLIELENNLKTKVVLTNGTKGHGIEELISAMENIKNESIENLVIKYPNKIESALKIVEEILIKKFDNKINTRWVSLRLLEDDLKIVETLNSFLGLNIVDDEEILNALEYANKFLLENNISKTTFNDIVASTIVEKSELICQKSVKFNKENYNSFDRKIDKYLTSKKTGFLVMIVLLAFIFWLTIAGSNYPSEVISNFLFLIQDKLLVLFNNLKIPDIITDFLILGVYRVVAWVVSVMLPPMAIFFPLFTLLEDLGYLPRVAFNLDSYFKKCNACGKQALTMCMGFGCNAAGVIGCRIIDSKRERLIAIITNNFVPCNGRFPTLIAIITMFFIPNIVSEYKTILSVLILTITILLGVFMTLLISKILSITILKGIPSSFTLELPPYRKPQILKILVHSVFDRTLFVLGRAVAIAIPAGMLIWIMANITISNASILYHCSNFLEPFGKLIGLDGVILMAFILGFPANEIVIPIIIMSYMQTGKIMELNSLDSLKNLLVSNGWSYLTAINMMIFSLMHWPCSTTLLTIKKETKSLKWTIISFLIPTLTGILLCFLTATIAKFI